MIENPFQLNQQSSIVNRQYKGMAYIGHRPTINGMSQNIEVNMFDFNEDIYHETIRLDFLHFIRHDIKFEGLAKLTEQLAKDKISTLAYFENQTHKG